MIYKYLSQSLLMRTFLLVLSLPILMASCASDETSDQDGVASDTLPAMRWPEVDSLPPLTSIQDSAFQALNTLQVGTDEKNRLYSTFGNINHSCYPPDTVVMIPQIELLEAMNAFVQLHCTLMSEDERNQLTSASVLAQEYYTVSLCLNETKPSTFEKGIPRSGKWVLTNVLGRRDVTLVW